MANLYLKAIYEPKGYDFSYFDAFPQPHLHFIYSLNSPEKENLLKELEGKNEDDYIEVVTQAAINKRKSHPKHHRKLESYENMRLRAVQFASFLGKFITEKKVNPDEVAVVGHSTFIGYSEATSFNEYNKGIYKMIPNCAFALINISKLAK